MIGGDGEWIRWDMMRWLMRWDEIATYWIGGYGEWIRWDMIWDGKWDEITTYWIGGRWWMN